MPATLGISVVVATRNRAAFLSKALESLAAQRCAAGFEVVVVDNGSDDPTPDVILDVVRGDARFRTVAEPTVGLSHAKNAGLRAALGSLVLFTDDDVVIDHGWIASYTDFFARWRGGPVIAGGPVLPVPHDLTQWPPWVGRGARADLPTLFHGDVERQLRPFEWLWGANMAAPRELLVSLDGFHPELGRGARDATFEDVDLVDRLRGMGGEAWYCPGAPIYHRVNSSEGRPRKMMLTAFNRGCNDRAAIRHGIYFEPAVRVPTNSLAAGFALPGLLVALTLSAASFRLFRRPPLFDVARRSSWGAGWCMWSVLGESSRRRARVVRSVVLTVRQLALRVTPA